MPPSHSGGHGHPTVLALTATASSPVRDEIVTRLGMRHPRIMVRRFDRPNIRLGVEVFEIELTKKHAFLDRILEADKPGIIYVATRKRAKELAEALSGYGVKAVFYHAGMGARERERAQEAFLSDEEEAIVATAAFGSWGASRSCGGIRRGEIVAVGTCSPTSGRRWINPASTAIPARLTRRLS